MQASSGVRPGLRLGDSRYESEAHDYLSDRLKIAYGVVLVGSLALYVIGKLLRWFMSEPLGFFDPSSIVHLGACAIAAVVFLLLEKRDCAARSLRFLDGLLLFLCVGTSVGIYALLYEEPGIGSAIGVLCTFVIARAVVIPSTATRTFLLSLLAPLSVLAVELGYGRIHDAPDAVRDDAAFFVASVIWHQAMIFLAVGVATVASRVNFALRTQVDRALRLGQYQLEEKIGEGGMGEVYRATHAMLRRPTAIKVLRPEITGEETLERFAREVRETARLTHPNTISIYDYGRTPSGVFYYAMELLDGHDLDEIVKRTGPMSPSRVIRVLRQACAGLADAHAHDLVHRDIKPANIVLCAYAGGQDIVKVVDFGLVKNLQSTDPGLTAIGAIAGTPETLAPEVLGGREASPRSDIYSLAAVGCFCLTGKPIFDAGSVGEFVVAHMHSDPIPVRERDPSLPQDLEAVLLRCLAKDPAERPASMTELRAQLANCRDAGRWTDTEAIQWWESYSAADAST